MFYFTPQLDSYKGFYTWQSLNQLSSGVVKWRRAQQHTTPEGQWSVKQWWKSEKTCLFLELIWRHGPVRLVFIRCTTDGGETPGLLVFPFILYIKKIKLITLYSHFHKSCHSMGKNVWCWFMMTTEIGKWRVPKAKYICQTL